MNLAHDLLSFAGVLLATIAGGVFVLLAIANLWASDEACQPAPDPDPKKKPEPAAPPAAAPGPTTNPVELVGWRFHQTRPDVQIQASLSPPLSTRREALPEAEPAGCWYSSAWRPVCTDPQTPCWMKRFLLRLLCGVRWIPYHNP
jgi:hypothetical protein